MDWATAAVSLFSAAAFMDVGPCKVVAFVNNSVTNVDRVSKCSQMWRQVDKLLWSMMYFFYSSSHNCAEQLGPCCISKT